MVVVVSSPTLNDADGNGECDRHENNDGTQGSTTKTSAQDDKDDDDWNDHKPRPSSQPSQEHTTFSFRTSSA
jgi:hypothetical protein